MNVFIHLSREKKRATLGALSHARLALGCCAASVHLRRRRRAAARRRPRRQHHATSSVLPSSDPHSLLLVRWPRMRSTGLWDFSAFHWQSVQTYVSSERILIIVLSILCCSITRVRRCCILTTCLLGCPAAECLRAFYIFHETLGQGARQISHRRHEVRTVSSLIFYRDCSPRCRRCSSILLCRCKCHAAARSISLAWCSKHSNHTRAAPSRLIPWPWRSWPRSSLSPASQ